MPGLSKRDLHARLVTALGAKATPSAIDDVPLLLRVEGIAVPLAVWAFTLTNPPGGRHPAESKIQLMMPGQGNRQRGNLVDHSGGFKVLVGVHPTDDIFVLWDAYKQNDFTYSKNVQVRGPLLWDAALSGIAIGQRRLTSGTETVIVARGDRLAEAIKLRIAGE
jgi:hypothetical protein